MRWFQETVLLLATLLFAAAETPAASVSVKVVNRTAGASVPAGLAVTLNVTRDGETSSYGPAATNENGVARFEIPDSSREASAAAVAGYQGVKYESAAVPLPGGAASAEIELAVYEATTSRDIVVVVFHHSVLRPMKGAVQVAEMLMIENRGDRTYVGERELQPGLRAVFEYALPAGYRELELGKGLMACCVLQLDGKLIDTMEIKPGRRTVQFRYVIPAAESKLPYQPDIAFATERYNLLVDPALAVESATGLRNSDSAGYDTETFVSYEAADLAPGAELQVNVAGIPFDRTPQLRWATVGAALLLAVFLLVLALQSRRTAPAQGIGD